MDDNLSIDLRGAAVPDGQIDVPDLVDLTAALQRLATRLGRLHVGQRSGRTSSLVESATRLRLHAVRLGSTGLDFAIGESRPREDHLDVVEAMPGVTVGRLLDVFSGMASNFVPVWVTPSIGEAALQVLDALEGAAPECVVDSQRADRPISFAPAEVERDSWAIAADKPVARENVEVSGLLELVDLKPPARFRLRDDVGNAIQLDHVRNADQAKTMIGALVSATGTAFLRADNRIVRVRDAAVSKVVMPTWLGTLRAEFTNLSDAGPGSSASGVEGLSDDEVADFLASIRR